MGLGENLYLAKVAMDILAKKVKVERQEVRLASLTEESYRRRLWSHQRFTISGKSEGEQKNDSDDTESTLWEILLWYPVPVWRRK